MPHPPVQLCCWLPGAPVDLVSPNSKSRFWPCCSLMKCVTPLLVCLASKLNRFFNLSCKTGITGKLGSQDFFFFLSSQNFKMILLFSGTAIILKSCVECETEMLYQHKHFKVFHQIFVLAGNVFHHCCSLMRSVGTG